MSENERITLILAIITVAIVLVLLAISTFSALAEFNKELKYLNKRINKTSGREKKHYIKRRRRLWLSLIPFVKY